VEVQYNFLNTINTEQDIHFDIATKLDQNKEFIQSSIFDLFEINLEIFRTKDWNYRASINLTDNIHTTRETPSNYDLYVDQMYRVYEEDEYSKDYLYENLTLNDLNNLISDEHNKLDELPF